MLALLTLADAGTRVERETTTFDDQRAQSVSICSGDLCRHSYEAIARCRETWTSTQFGDRIRTETYPNQAGIPFVDSYGVPVFLQERDAGAFLVYPDREERLEGAEGATGTIEPVWGTYTFLAFTKQGTHPTVAWMGNGWVRVVDEHRGHWLSAWDTLFFAHETGGFSTFDGWDLTFTAPAPFEGSGAFVEVQPFSERFLWVFERALVVVDADLVPQDAVARPQDTQILPSPDGETVYAVDGSGRWASVRMPLYPDE